MSYLVPMDRESSSTHRGSPTYRRKSFSAVFRRGEVACIHDARLSACVWRRSLPLSLAEELSAATARATELGPVRVVEPDALVPHLRALVGALPSRVESAWERDAQGVLGAYWNVMPGKVVTVQLEIVTTDKCKRFHADYKSVRAVCTYVGPGTEWVEERAVSREEVSRHCHATSFEAQNALIVRDPSRIERAHPGDVVFLKGESYPGNAGRGVVHRSPPIEASGARRLVLTLDV